MLNSNFNLAENLVYRKYHRAVCCLHKVNEDHEKFIQEFRSFRKYWKKKMCTHTHSEWVAWTNGEWIHAKRNIYDDKKNTHTQLVWQKRCGPVSLPADKRLFWKFNPFSFQRIAHGWLHIKCKWESGAWILTWGQKAFPLWFVALWMWCANGLMRVVLYFAPLSASINRCNCSDNAPKAICIKICVLDLAACP